MTTKEKIFKSALKLFAKQGIDKTSTTQITQDAGIAAGTLFVHFKTKQELIDTLYLDIKKKAFSELVELIDYKQSAEKNIKRLSREIVQYFVKNYPEFIFMELVENDPQVSQKAVQEGRKVYAYIPKALRKWQREGILKKIDLALMVNIIWNVLIVLIRYCKEKRIEKVSNVCLDVVWEAVRR